ncbi:diacylglycerol/lipid kinase family protein [Gelidibacter salicanalis]|uniref:diacylglycerol/lipid kinase family protein n=1 Tax=Gelidibacter salicanalis TaxID=291193 RepID=UPI0027DC4CD5|nr:hypothetical protein [Gelidibacter salicanalis]
MIENYEASQKRTLRCYVKACYKTFREYYKKEEVVIAIDHNIVVIHPFLIFISNSNVMGYSMSLTPKASLKDGLLDVIVVPKIARLRMLYFGLLMLLKKPELLKEVKYFQTTALNLTRKRGAFFASQIDGGWSKTEVLTMSVALKEESLSVLV